MTLKTKMAIVFLVNCFILVAQADVVNHESSCFPFKSSRLTILLQICDSSCCVDSISRKDTFKYWPQILPSTLTQRLASFMPWAPTRKDLRKHELCWNDSLSN